jgi:hypothetical protein
VRALTASPWFEWSVTGFSDWTPLANDAINYGGLSTLDANTEIRGLIFNGSVWVCGVFVKTASANNYPQFLYSSDGKIWTSSVYDPVNVPTFGIANEIRGAYKIAWNGYMLVATGTSTNVSVAYSTDNGVTWKAVANSRSNVIQFGRGIAWNGKAWLLTGTPAATGKPIAYSFNGINWTPVAVSNTLLDIGYSVATDGMRWVVGGNISSADREPIYSDSESGVDGWNSVNGWPGEFSDTLVVSDLSWNGRQWIALTAKDISKNTVLVSDLGGTWQTTGQTGGSFDLAESVTWNSSAWLITGTSNTAANRLKYSIDSGVTWTSISGRTVSTSVASRTIVPLLNKFGDINAGRNVNVNPGNIIAAKNANTLGGDTVLQNDTLSLGANSSKNSFIKSSEQYPDSQLRLVSGTRGVQTSGDLIVTGTATANTISSGNFTTSAAYQFIGNTGTGADSVVRIRNGTADRSIYIQANSSGANASLAAINEASFIGITNANSYMTTRNSFRVNNTATSSSFGFTTEQGPRIVTDSGGVSIFDDTLSNIAISTVAISGGNAVYTLSSALARVDGLGTQFKVFGVSGGSNFNYIGFKYGTVGVSGLTITIANDFSASGNGIGGTLQYFNATAAALTIGSTGITLASNKKLTVTSTLGLGTSANPVALCDTASGTTAYVSGNLNSTGSITATSFSGPTTGNVTGAAGANLTLSADSGRNIELRNGTTPVVTVAPGSVTLAQPLQMGSNAISGATTVTASGIVSAGGLTLTGSIPNVNSAINTGSNAITTTSISSSFPLKSYTAPTAAATSGQVLWGEGTKTAGIYRITLTYLNNAAIASATGSSPLLTLVQYHVLKTSNTISFSLTTLVGGATSYFDVSSNNIIKNSTLVAGAFAHIVEERLA